MEKEQFIAVLQEIGLSEKEARVYLANVALGPATVLSIAREAGIKRTTVYAILDVLVKNGLVSVEIKGSKKKYAAENPQKLESVLDQRKNKLELLLPELNAIYSLKAGQSFIRYYEGISAMENVYAGLLEEVYPGDEYLILGDMEQFLKVDREFFTDFIEKRGKKGFKIRTLLQNSEIGQHYKKFEKNTSQSIRILPQGTALTSNLVIVPNKVIITILVSPIITMVIENKSVVQMHREQFNIIWNSVLPD